MTHDDQDMAVYDMEDTYTIVTNYHHLKLPQITVSPFTAS